MIWLLAAALLLGATSADISQRKTYNGYRVLRMTPTTVEQLKFLKNLMNTEEHLDFWVEPSRVGQEVEMMVAPLQLRRIQVQLRKQEIGFEKAVDNVQSLLDTMWKEYDSSKNARGKKVFDLNEYNTLEDINLWLEDSVNRCRGGFTCSVYSIGNSALGLPINVFSITGSGAGRKAYWIDSAIHAREWIAPATILNVLNNLITGGDANAERLVDDYDWYILPVMNPDGYSYSHTDDRMWRKNRNPNEGSICVGTDLNRNFDFRWGNEGVSHMPCGATYCGPSAGSESETQAVQRELVRLGPSLLAMVTVHSYGNMWMFPPGNTINYAGVTCDRAADHNAMMRISDVTANAIEATYGTRWARGTSCEVIYETTGGTDDYAKFVAGIEYSFCPELRGNTFLLPTAQIVLSYNEFWNGIVAMVAAIAED